MNKQLQGSLIQRPNEAPSITPPPKMERFWHAEHFGNISTVDDKIVVAKKTGQFAKDVATSDEAKAAGKGVMNIVLEGIKILASSAAGIAIFTGILLILEQQVIKGNMSIKSLFQMTRIVFFITLGVGFGGLIMTHLMTQVTAIKDQAGVIAEDERVQEGIKEAEEVAEDAEIKAAIESATSSNTVSEVESSVPDSVQEGVSEASSVVEESGITS